MNVKPFLTRYYDDSAALKLRRNKANQTQMPAFGAKGKALNVKPETGTFDGARFEKTKPICAGLNARKLFFKRGL
ncbi:MAG: hypothetical protein PVJ86_08590 [Phycisphaerales bacterium]|jgi:hypothetical protein